MEITRVLDFARIVYGIIVYITDRLENKAIKLWLNEVERHTFKGRGKNVCEDSNTERENNQWVIERFGTRERGGDADYTGVSNGGGNL